MQKQWWMLFGMFVAVGCGAEEPVDPTNDEEAATSVSSKDDSLAERIVFGRFENRAASPGTFSSLELLVASRAQLPAAHFEGRYILETAGEDGAERSEGAFNVYRYGGTDWIRFVDDASGRIETPSEKYAWSITDNTMSFEALSGERFKLELTERLVEYECSWGVEGSEFLEFDVTDPYDRTPAEHLETVSSLSAASFTAVRILENAAEFEGVTTEDYLASFDDRTVTVYDVSWFTTAFEMVLGYQGDTEVGIIFDAGINSVRAIVSDGDIIGCNDDGECGSNVSSSFPETTSSLLAEPLATELAFMNDAASLTELAESQMRAALLHTGWDDAGELTAAELLDYTDDGGFYYYEVGDSMHWLQWWAGDNEVGAFFEKDTTNLVGVVGDGEISACAVVD